MAKLLEPLAHPGQVPEARWQRIIHDLLDAYGWHRLHIPPVRVGKTWITPGRKGFPDVCALHPAGACLVLELKTEVGDARPEQRQWMALWQRVAAGASNVDAFVARPSDFNAVITYIAAFATPSAQGSLFDAGTASPTGL
jgi:hypothetical protein